MVLLLIKMYHLKMHFASFYFVLVDISFVSKKKNVHNLKGFEQVPSFSHLQNQECTLSTSIMHVYIQKQHILFQT